MNDVLKEKLIAVINTLGTITVSGKNNMKVLAACIEYLENMVNETPENQNGEKPKK